jgi:Putative FMN-binding domain
MCRLAIPQIRGIVCDVGRLRAGDVLVRVEPLVPLVQQREAGIRATLLLAGSMEGRYKAMYIPKAFQVLDSAVLDAFITHNSFAMLVSTVDSTLFATHLPLILDRTQSSSGVLLGHVARANSHWRAFDGQQEALAIFHGPHAYISPS